MNALRLESVSKEYPGTFQLQKTDLCIHEGEFFALLGPSGCGKTTLLRLIAGLAYPDLGEIWFGSQRITYVPAEKRGFGMVFQLPLLFPHMTVEDNVAFGLKMQGVSKSQRHRHALEMLEYVGLAGYGSRYPAELSGGQQQRVSLARALVAKPKLLLMDEPFSSLDSEIREEMQELVKRMHQEYKTTIVFVTHDRDEAFLLANRIGVMQNGKILQVGKPQELYEHPVHHQVALLLGAKNVWQGELRNGYFYSGDAHIQLHDGYGETKQTGWLILRPEIFRVVQENGNVTKDDRMIEGTIKQLSFRQGFYYIQVHIGSHTLLVIEKPERDMRLFPGQPVRLAYDRNKIQFLPDVPERKE